MLSCRLSVEQHSRRTAGYHCKTKRSAIGTGHWDWPETGLWKLSRPASGNRIGTATWPHNALPFLVTCGVSSALSRRFADYTSSDFPEADSGSE